MEQQEFYSAIAGKMGNMDKSSYFKCCGNCDFWIVGGNGKWDCGHEDGPPSSGVLEMSESFQNPSCICDNWTLNQVLFIRMDFSKQAEETNEGPSSELGHISESPNSYLTLEDGTTWPVDNYTHGNQTLEHRLRHGGVPSTADALKAASFIHSYDFLINDEWMNAKDAINILRMLRRAYKANREKLYVYKRKKGSRS